MRWKSLASTRLALGLLAATLAACGAEPRSTGDRPPGANSPGGPGGPNSPGGPGGPGGGGAGGGRGGASAAAGPGGKGAPPVPILSAKVAREDVPIELEGLGSVAAYATVTVRPQVDGLLARVLFREGQLVKKGELLAELDARPFEIQVRQAQAALARDRAQLDNARRTLERNRTLRGENLIAQQALDDLVAQAAQLEALVALDQAQLDEKSLALSYTRVLAPIAGRTGLRLVDAGNLVRASDATGLVVVAALDPVAVLFSLPQDELPRVAEAMLAGPLTVEAIAREGDERLGVGQVELIDNQINAATGTMKLKALFPNPRNRLWPNQFVKARLHIATERQALVVPAAVVQRGPKGAFAYVVQGDDTVLLRPIEVGTIFGERALIRSGLEAGEVVVVEGQYRLSPGARVTQRDPKAAESAPRAEGEKVRTATAARRGAL